jgi:hypothetical protein
MHGLCGLRPNLSRKRNPAGQGNRIEKGMRVSSYGLRVAGYSGMGPIALKELEYWINGMME